MPDAVAVRTVDWLCGVVDLMRDPAPVMPVRPLLQMLRRTFDCTATSWNWTAADGGFGVIMDPPDLLLTEPEFLELWVSGEALDCNALLVWFTLTDDPAPMTLGRVPTGLVARRKRVLLERPLKRLGIEQQLSIVYRKAGREEYAFVVVRASRDFDDHDVELAGLVQRSLRSLDQQCVALTQLTERAGSLSAGADLGLSGREIAVLQLVADGYATRLIGRRLGCTPRTVEKHLERCFRKLGVRDRLNAVRVARLAGVLGVRYRPPLDDPTVPEPGEFRARAYRVADPFPAG